MAKEKINVSLDSEVVDMLKKQAKAESMQVSPYLQILLRAHFGMSKMLQTTTNDTPKKLTPVNKLEEPVPEPKTIDEERKAKIMAEWSDDDA